MVHADTVFGEGLVSAMHIKGHLSVLEQTAAVSQANAPK